MKHFIFSIFGLLLLACNPVYAGIVTHVLAYEIGKNSAQAQNSTGQIFVSTTPGVDVIVCKESKELSGACRVVNGWNTYQMWPENYAHRLGYRYLLSVGAMVQGDDVYLAMEVSNTDASVKNSVKSSK